MSEGLNPITTRAEFASLLPGYLNGLLGAADTQRMERALQQHPQWRHDLEFDGLWKQTMQSHQPKLDEETAWFMFKKRLEQENLLPPHQHDH